MMSLAGLSFLAPPVIGVALYELAEPGPFIGNSVLLAAALILCFISGPLKAAPSGRGRRTMESPASQPGPEGKQNLS